MSSTEQDVIERVARVLDDTASVTGPGDSDHIHFENATECAVAALASLRPGDRLPNGLVVCNQMTTFNSDGMQTPYPPEKEAGT